MNIETEVASLIDPLLTPPSDRYGITYGGPNTLARRGGHYVFVSGPSATSGLVNALLLLAAKVDDLAARP